MKWREYFFCAKKTKQRFYSTICLLCFSIAPFWKISTGRKQLLCQPRHKDTSSMLVYALNWIKTALPCGVADTLLASSGYSPKWHYTDTEEMNCWIKSFFCFLCAEKSILVASLNSDWTTDGRWSILTMLLILLWTLTVQFTMQSMGQSQASRFSSKIS